MTQKFIGVCLNPRYETSALDKMAKDKKLCENTLVAEFGPLMFHYEHANDKCDKPKSRVFGLDVLTSNSKYRADKGLSIEPEEEQAIAMLKLALERLERGDYTTADFPQRLVDDDFPSDLLGKMVDNMPAVDKVIEGLFSGKGPNMMTNPIGFDLHETILSTKRREGTNVRPLPPVRRREDGERSQF